MTIQLTKTYKDEPILVNLKNVAAVERDNGSTLVIMDFQEPGNVDVCPQTYRVKEDLHDIKAMLLRAGLYLKRLLRKQKSQHTLNNTPNALNHDKKGIRGTRIDTKQMPCLRLVCRRTKPRSLRRDV